MVVATDRFPVRYRRRVDARIRSARAASAIADTRAVAVRNRQLRWLGVGSSTRLAGDVRRLLLHVALHTEHHRLLAYAGRRELPADDRSRHPGGPVRRAVLRPHRLSLAAGNRDGAG